jgi:hypothetical protein
MKLTCFLKGHDYKIVGTLLGQETMLGVPLPNTDKVMVLRECKRCGHLHATAETAKTSTEINAAWLYHKLNEPVQGAD